MPGGGPHGVGPGQVTDDSELALCLFQALKDANPKDGLPAQNVAKMYHKWYDSDPFDIGNTCATAMSNPPEHMTIKAGLFNTGSKSNGALMRATPIAVWGRDLTVAQLAVAASEDAGLSHPNPTCRTCNAAYCCAIQSLISRP